MLRTRISRTYSGFDDRYCVRKDRFCLKLTGEEAGIGPRRENSGFPESKKVETLNFVILDPN